MNTLQQLKTQQSETENISYAPTKHQKLWIETEIKLQTTSVLEISKTCGIDRSSWYRWIRDPEFVGWYRREWETILKSQAPILDKVGMQKAVRGDFRFWETMMRRVGNLSSAEGMGVAFKEGDKEIKVIVTRGYDNTTSS